MGKFCTVINCMDGRVQLPVIAYLQKHFGAEYVDSITEPGPNRIVAEENPGALLQSILARMAISLEKHNSVGIAVAGHAGCAGNPTPKDVQTTHTKKAVENLKKRYPNTPVIGLWLDESFTVQAI